MQLGPALRLTGAARGLLQSALLTGLRFTNVQLQRLCALTKARPLRSRDFLGLSDGSTLPGSWPPPRFRPQRCPEAEAELPRGSRSKAALLGCLIATVLEGSDAETALEAYSASRAAGQLDLQVDDVLSEARRA